MELAKSGLTGVHDAGAGREDIERYLRWAKKGRLPLRIYAMAGGVGPTLNWLCHTGGVADGTSRVSARSVKLFADGALGSRGAALLEDYSDSTGNQGLLFVSDAELEAQVDAVLECGFQVAIHAIGDAANRQALDALEQVMARHSGNPGRHRIEHAQVIHAEDIVRFDTLGVVASVQPTHATSDMYWAEQRLGGARVRGAYAWRSLLDSGARLALGSDFPVEDHRPMLGLYAAVTRRDLDGAPEQGWYADQALSRVEALRGFTLDAAFASFMEDEVGSIEVGKRADLVIIDRDIMQVPAREIADTQVLETWVDGRRVWPAADQPVDSN